jgi:hypothetical protein
LYLKRVSRSPRQSVDHTDNQLIVPTIRRSRRQSGDHTDNQAIVPTIRRSYRQSGDRTDNQAIVPTIRRSYRQSGDRADKQSESKETRKVSCKWFCNSRKCSSRTSAIGEVGPPLRLSQVCCVDQLPLLMTGTH